MRIYLMRHGETVWNKVGIIQGRSKNRLSSDGKQQVELQAKKYKDVNFDFIISSPLVRTIQTSNIMNQFHGVKIFRDNRIIEVGQGIYTGRHKNTMSDDDWKNYNNRPDGYEMEPYEDIVLRTKAFVEDLKSNYYDKAILVVTHRWVAKILYYIFKGIPFTREDMVSQEMFGNAEIEIIDCN